MYWGVIIVYGNSNFWDCNPESQKVIYLLNVVFYCFSSWSSKVEWLDLLKVYRFETLIISVDPLEQVVVELVNDENKLWSVIDWYEETIDNTNTIQAIQMSNDFAGTFELYFQNFQYLSNDLMITRILKWGLLLAFNFLVDF